MTESEKLNIVLVTVDSLRADHCGFMGYEKNTTPNLDEMAEDGVVFENAIAPAPFTEESVPPMFTGSYPVHTENAKQLGKSTRIHINKHRSIAQELSEMGYSTGGFSPNPHASRHFGLDRGFDTFHDFIGDSELTEVKHTMWSRAQQGDFVECLRLGANMVGMNIPGFANQSIPIRAYYDRILNWVTNAEEPFFLWIFPLEVHSPYRPKAAYRDIWFPEMLYLNYVRSYFVDRNPNKTETEKLLELYDGAIRSIDESIAQLRDDLSKYNPILIITSDHGESFGEHGNFGHNDSLHTENVRVPLVISGVEKDDRVSEPVSLRSLPDIIYNIAESGTSAGEFSESTAFTRVRKKKISVQDKRTNYIASVTSSELYNISDDLKQQRSEQETIDEHILRKTIISLNDREERFRIVDSVVNFLTEGDPDV